ncbi:hypothetical protein TIFTF001_022306 [Ficus carica]|uniref:RNase H type-1 domain-containing protein n=1 Tax=Ficus carica TaxID=3494 RepID=A0AA88AZH0_FICCA|nr:hypothetical protein TIFTF001_022306 [Ficus carica]
MAFDLGIWRRLARRCGQRILILFSKSLWGPAMVVISGSGILIRRECINSSSSSNSDVLCCGGENCGNCRCLMPTWVVRFLERWGDSPRIWKMCAGLPGNFGAIGTKVIHGADGSDPQSVLDLGLASFGEWQALHWLFSQHRSDHIGVGAVLRNEYGLLCGALAKTLDGSFSPLLAVCLSSREGLKFAKEMEVDALVVETDVIKLLVLALNGDLELSVVGPVHWKIFRPCLMFCSCLWCPMFEGMQIKRHTF